MPYLRSSKSNSMQDMMVIGRIPLIAALIAFATLLACSKASPNSNLLPADGESTLDAPLQWTPDNTGRVTDLAEILPVDRANAISDMLAEYERQTTHEFAVLTVEDLRGEAIENFSLRVARAWGVGKRDKNNGLLIVVARDDRVMRIEIADGLTSLISNEMAAEIIETDMSPAFKDDRFAEGIEAALTSLMDAARGS